MAYIYKASLFAQEQKKSEWKCFEVFEQYCTEACVHWHILQYIQHSIVKLHLNMCVCNCKKCSKDLIDHNTNLSHYLRLSHRKCGTQLYDKANAISLYKFWSRNSQAFYHWGKGSWSRRTHSVGVRFMKTIGKLLGKGVEWLPMTCHVGLICKINCLKAQDLILALLLCPKFLVIDQTSLATLPQASHLDQAKFNCISDDVPLFWNPG